jgi:NTE family protein
MDPTERGVEKLVKVWRSLTTSRILLGWEPHLPTAAPAFAGAFVVAAIRRVTLGYPSLYGDSGLRHLFHEHLAGMRFEDTQVPFRVIASNLSTGGITVFGRGPTELALLASAAIPGIFPPVRIAGDIFVDGGALESSSIDTAIQLGARRIFVLDAGYDVTPELEDELQMLLRRQSRNGRPSNAHALAVMLERTATMMGRYQLDRSIARVPPGIEVHVIRPTSTMNEAALDFDHAASWINLSYEQAKASLDRGLSLRQSAQPTPAGAVAGADSDASDASDDSDASDVAAANDPERDAASGAVAQRAG